jgi:hypothetical protein
MTLQFGRCEQRRQAKKRKQVLSVEERIPRGNPLARELEDDKGPRLVWAVASRAILPGHWGAAGGGRHEARRAALDSWTQEPCANCIGAAEPQRYRELVVLRLVSP